MALPPLSPPPRFPAQHSRKWIIPCQARDPGSGVAEVRPRIASGGNPNTGLFPQVMIKSSDCPCYVEPAPLFSPSMPPREQSQDHAEASSSLSTSAFSEASPAGALITHFSSIPESLSAPGFH
jgi:hypothetical protein